MIRHWISLKLKKWEWFTERTLVIQSDCCCLCSPFSQAVASLCPKCAEHSCSRCSEATLVLIYARWPYLQIFFSHFLLIFENKHRGSFEFFSMIKVPEATHMFFSELRMFSSMVGIYLAVSRSGRPLHLQALLATRSHYLITYVV